MNLQGEFELGTSPTSKPTSFYDQWVAQRLTAGEEPGAKLNWPVRPDKQQEDLQFEADPWAAPSFGYEQWVARRRLTAEELGRKLNLPVGHPVEVWLKGGVRLRGRLRLKDDFLLIEEDRLRQLVLLVDGVPFTFGDIESCVRQDG